MAGSSLAPQEEPNKLLGVDLVWWRARIGRRTVVSLYWWFGALVQDRFSLDVRLYDGAGRERARHTQPLAPHQFVILDSRTLADFTGDGVLSLTVTTERSPSRICRTQYSRLYCMVDWVSDRGDLVTLHSDQVHVPPEAGEIALPPDPEQPLELTEIAVDGSDPSAALIWVNGPSAEPVGAVYLTATDHTGRRQECLYPAAFPPFSIQHLQLAEQFPAWRDFAEQREVVIGGALRTSHLFARPYVYSRAMPYESAYHGGNLYRGGELAYPAYRFLGEGPVNPALALHDEEVTTTVYLFHSHGGVEQDAWVGIRLYDKRGELVAEERKWLRAVRGGVSRGDIAALVPRAAQPFAGHLALRFFPEPGRSYPPVIQALVEYRNSVSQTRVMLWSDDWNSEARRRRASLEAPWVSYFRVWLSPDVHTRIGITHCAVEENYQEVADARLILTLEGGAAYERQLSLPAHATALHSVADLFPEAIAEGAVSPFGLLRVESRYDLANMQISQHARSGALAAEHFLCAARFRKGELVWPAGA
jgi:hypothetical protein